MSTLIIVGHLHLGGLRTALFNYLFAKSRGGDFIIRIEDTDQTRLVDGAADKIIRDLEWAGLKADESPLAGGILGPYVQSQRLDIYKREVATLLDSGHAYHCFCTERRLDLLRRDALRARQVPKYDNRCRHLTPGQIAEKLAAKDTFCIRFRLDDFDDTYQDLVYGDVGYNVANIEGDPVILKTDGYPTYHYANVIDDHFMRITHVLRGVEWQVSTTKHLLMYKAFGWTPPQYAHLPLIMNNDGSKLSKRQGDIQIDYYKNEGIFPTSLVNYIIQSGGGFNLDPSERLRNFSLEELVKLFDFTRINAHSSRLNPDLLLDLNRMELVRRISVPDDCNAMVDEVRDLVKRSFPRKISTLDLSTEHIKNILKWSSTRISTLKDLVDDKNAFLWVLPTGNHLEKIPSEAVDLLVSRLSQSEKFTKESLNLILREFSASKGLPFGSLMKSLRSCLSGLNEGPGVAEMMEILGKKNTMHRITASRKK